MIGQVNCSMSRRNGVSEEKRHTNNIRFVAAGLVLPGLGRLVFPQ
jgi:hypothetical protein